LAAAHAREKLNGYYLQDNGKLRVEFTMAEKMKQQEFANSSTYANLKSAANRYSNQQFNDTTVYSSNQPAEGSGYRYNHDSPKFKATPCEHFLAGNCRFGTSCLYKHETNGILPSIKSGITMGLQPMKPSVMMGAYDLGKQLIPGIGSNLQMGILNNCGYN